MNVLAANLVFAVIWAALSGAITAGSLATGFALGYLALWMIRPLTGSSTYSFRVYAWARLVVLFHWELILSSVQVAYDVLTPRHRARPALLKMPLDVKSDAGILLVTNLITLTPGTLSLDVSEDRKTLLIHAMFADDPEDLIARLKSGMERWVIDAVEG